MSSLQRKTERFHVLVPEESNLIIPVGDSFDPVIVSSLQSLFVDVEVLSHAKPEEDQRCVKILECSPVVIVTYCP